MSDIVRANAEADPKYAPYCMRCPRMERMTEIKRFKWRCVCGGVCDLRTQEEKEKP